MEKIYLRSGKEVQIGDTIVKVSEVKDPIFGKGIDTIHLVITKDILPKLIKAGIVTTKPAPAKVAKDNTKNNPNIGIPMELEYYIQKIADRLGWKIEKTYNYLNTVDTILPAAAFSMILREVAIELDKKYKDHIENSPKIYVISMLNGRIVEANKAHIKNYRNFAAFRSINDAVEAKKVLKEVLKELFSNDKKQED